MRHHCFPSAGSVIKIVFAIVVFYVEFGATIPIIRPPPFKEAQKHQICTRKQLKSQFLSASALRAPIAMKLVRKESK